jgi:hypothetical protein
MSASGMARRSLGAQPTATSTPPPCARPTANSGTTTGELNPTARRPTWRPSRTETGIPVSSLCLSLKLGVLSQGGETWVHPLSRGRPGSLDQRTISLCGWTAGS